jgi:hypothetical protein
LRKSARNKTGSFIDSQLAMGRSSQSEGLSCALLGQGSAMATASPVAEHGRAASRRQIVIQMVLLRLLLALAMHVWAIAAGGGLLLE